MLRKVLIRMVVAVGLTATAGCVGSIEGEEALGNNGPQLTWEEFRDSVYQEPGPNGLFIVDGDTPIDGEKNLREFYDRLFPQGGRLIVHTVGGSDAAWTSTQKLNLTYCISNNFGTSNKAKVVTAMAQATANWQGVANVQYVYKSDQDANCTASNNNVLFDVRPVNSGGQYLARAFFPDSGRSSRNVLIDNTAFGSLGSWTLRGILTHELGHTLGFRHEHTRPESGTCFEDNNWRPLTPYDSASVMHYPQCNGSQSGDLVITSKDQQGAAALYGAPGTDPDPPEEDPTQTKTDSGSLAKNAQIQLGGVAVKPGTVFTAVMTGSGDPDLYVRFGSAPTTSSYNCRPYLNGANETCTLTVPANATTAYVMVRGYTAATYSVTRTWTAP